MNSEGKVPMVLIVDDEAFQRATLDRHLRRLGGFRTLSVGHAGITRDEVFSLVFDALRTTRVDIAIVDVRLEMPTSNKDLVGLELAESIRRSYPDIGIVVKTAHTVAAELDQWERRHSELLSNVADAFFIRSQRKEYSDINDTVKNVLNKRVRANFSIHIEDSQDLINLLGGRLVGHDVNFIGGDSITELDLLLRKLFYEESHPPVRVRLEPLSTAEGLSSASVLVATPYYDEGDWAEPEIIKLDVRRRIEREVDNFRRYVHRRLGWRRAPTLERQAHTNNLGAFSLTKLGIRPGELAEMQRFWRVSGEDATPILNMIRELFEGTCARWYRAVRSADQRFDEWIGAEFGRPLDTITAAISRVALNSPSSSVIHLQAEPNVSCQNPLYTFSEVQRLLSGDYPQCVTHGDLNSRNLLVDSSGNPLLIDFYRTGPSFALRDFSMLEATIICDLLETENLSAFVRLANLLVDDASHESIELRSEYPELFKAQQVIMLVRELANRVNGIGRSKLEYFAATALYAIRYASFPDVPPIKARRAVAYAAGILSSKVDS